MKRIHVLASALLCGAAVAAVVAGATGSGTQNAILFVRRYCLPPISGCYSSRR